MILDGDGPFGPVTTALRDQDPVVQEYRALFAMIDWTLVPARDPARRWPGSPPHPTAAYLKTLLIKLHEEKPFITQVRAFLVAHPLLVVELGFRPVLDPTRPEIVIYEPAADGSSSRPG